MAGLTRLSLGRGASDNPGINLAVDISIKKAS
jgi:hypothetical protein